jgi:hypothetical protein
MTDKVLKTGRIQTIEQLLPVFRPTVAEQAQKYPQN